MELELTSGHWNHEDRRPVAQTGSESAHPPLLQTPPLLQALINKEDKETSYVWPVVTTSAPRCSCHCESSIDYMHTYLSLSISLSLCIYIYTHFIQCIYIYISIEIYSMHTHTHRPLRARQVGAMASSKQMRGMAMLAAYIHYIYIYA